MIDGFYPLIKTFTVPANIKAEFVGEFVSSATADFLDNLGRGGFDPRSVTLRPLHERLFVLSLRTHKRYALPEALDIREPDPRERGLLEEGEVVATRHKSRSR